MFFRITNSRATSKIIEQLLEKAHGTKYDTYWHGQPGAGGQRKIPGLFALIRQLNEKRNDIVHWHIRSSSSSTGDQWDDLTPAYYWTRGHQEPITTPDLNAFIKKANFVQSSIFHFCQFTTKASDVFLRAYGGKLETWTRIFEDQPNGLMAQRLRLLGALTVTNGVIRETLERDVRKGSHHPHVERIMPPSHIFALAET